MGFEVAGTFVQIAPDAQQRENGRGSQLIAHLRGRGDIALSTDTIMTLTRDD